MHYSLWKVGFCILLHHLFAWNLYAQQSVADTVLIKTDTVSVFKSLQEVKIYPFHLEKRERVVAPAQIIDGAGLQKLNSLSVADAVRFFSGAQLKDYGGIGGLKTIDVRSMGTNHTAVFYDGFQVGNAQNGQVDLGKFSLDNIESIGLYNGQRSTIFQPAEAFASGAVLYLESKLPEFKENEKTHIGVRFKTGSFGLVNPSVFWQQKISKQISSTLSSEITRAHGRYKFRYTNGVYDTTAIRHNADIHSFRLEAGLNGMLPDSSFWKLTFYSYQSERGLPGAIVANHFQNYQRLWNDDQFLQFSWKKKMNPWYEMKASAKISNTHTRYLDPFYQNIEGKLDNHFRESTQYFSLANQFTFSKNWTASLSADNKRSALNANLYHFPYPVRNTFLAVAATNIRFTRLQFQGSILGTYVHDKVKQFTGAGNKQEYTPAFNLSWQPLVSKDFHLRAFYKNIFRMPSFNDLYYTFIGNVKLRPEYAEQFNIGFIYFKYVEKGILNKFSISADGYQNFIKDKIVAVPGTNLFRWSMMNLGKVDIKGIDAVLNANWKITDSISLNTGLQYTFQQTLNVTPGGYNFKHQIPYIPRHSGSATASVSYQNWNLNYSFIYTGERYSQSANIAANYVPAWYTHDLALSKIFFYKKSTFKISGEMMNLANQYYDVVLNYPMPGRACRVSIALEL
ncbi:MAG: TonB-dependent receptor [Ginsengibacter sp.]